jgi:hypothetical protein
MREKKYGVQIYAQAPTTDEGAQRVKLDAAISEFGQGFLADVYKFSKEQGRPIQGGLVIILMPEGGAVLAGRGIDGEDSINLLEALADQLRASRDAAPKERPVS